GLVPGADDDAGARFEEAAGDGAADALAPARDDHRLAGHVDRLAHISLRRAWIDTLSRTCFTPRIQRSPTRSSRALRAGNRDPWASPTPSTAPASPRSS